MRYQFVAAALCAAALSRPVFAADADHGKQLFTACRACHSDGQHPATLGPSLVGVAGRKAGALDDFRYSPAMKRSDIVWTDQNLHEYLLDPQKKVKGNRMPYAGIGSAGDADDVIAYLHTLK